MPSAAGDCGAPINPARLFNDPHLLETILACMQSAAGADAAEDVSIDTRGVPRDQLYCAVGPDALHVTCYSPLAGRTFHVTVRYAG